MASFKQADLDNITKAIASGVLSATIQGEAVTYRSLGEMRTIKGLIEDDLAPSNTSFMVATPSFGRGI
jgi:hypothetical protein